MTGEGPQPTALAPLEIVRRPRGSSARLFRADWYKDAIIYQLHIKAFQDSTGDGIGDFRGLLQRLDYIEQLGVNAIWLLPFYPSPLRDDGYDIADYRSINPSYGTMRDFRRFIAEAQRRGISVITELVINHTSDQHPWFQKARRAKRGSAARNFYVWSDSDDRYAGTRIIFLDTEKSNWTWDSEAGQFYWHRFYSHQPDLNFDNPRVIAEILKVMRFWLEIGVDGLRLDAIPYLIEREGTSNENLPETHEVLKHIRATLDAEFPDRMLLAEANQWPEDTRPYFGDGDECHMAFHFPLMPRIYMALAQEDRHPISDIIRQTPEIPQSCQWAIFLRNHDELTLEMVTDRERDYLWDTYAADRRARINLGIRRRLAPLMQNDRRKMELMNALLFSMPGAPVVYYGDELGMGDNIFLGDRDGVRTPMQWSADRNGGFSRANPQELYLPPVMDPVYGFQTINVEAQQADPSSLLNWVRRMIGVRKQYEAFGRGEFTLLYPRNRKILAYIRSRGNEAILCVANLARSAQAVELDLSEFRHRVPVELVSQSPFPPIGELPYMLTLPGYGFFWFLLASEAQAPDWRSHTPDPLPEFITLTVARGRLDHILDGRERRQLEDDVLPQYLQRQRWFGAKDAELTGIRIDHLATLSEETGLLTIIEVDTGEAEPQRYLLPLTVLWGEENVYFGAPKLSFTLARVRQGPKLGALIDGSYDERLVTALLARMRSGATLETENGQLRFSGSPGLRRIDDGEPATPQSGEQSNVSISIGAKAMLKIYRRVRRGEQPEVEVARFLTESAGFANAPNLLGSVEFVDADGTTTTLASAFEFVINQGDAWTSFVEALDRDLEADILQRSSGEGVQQDAPGPVALRYPLDLVGTLGERTGEMHAAFAHPTEDEAFRRERLTKADISRLATDVRGQMKQAFPSLSRSRERMSPENRALADELSKRRREFEVRLQELAQARPIGAKTRIHGDYHLGQVLIAQQDLMIIDFEGEPHRSIEERRTKSSPLRDVAGMLRSFDYAIWTALARLTIRFPDLAWHPETLAQVWSEHLRGGFLEGYNRAAASAPDLVGDCSMDDPLLSLFIMQKAFYEIGYEAANRPDWLGIPLRGALDLLDGAGR
jgi:maltose alpha-D-glucosyltransferase / alpha-amylase